ncbi:hypothetical protein [Staphylococcus borealis]|uniref:hypothetical protein n=1 Tax=Staphylococcus borealis TaxID=2742203 RepID=UPI002DBDA46B|nr:hypothetical protein [Staphylococcus borealis]MEB7460170.1 hypothetical protein [Staphylococcus borealis]
MVKLEDKIFILIFSKKVRVVDICKYTGFYEAMIYQLRNGQRKIENLTLKTARTLERCYNHYESSGVISIDDLSIALNKVEAKGIKP